MNSQNVQKKNTRKFRNLHLPKTSNTKDTLKTSPRPEKIPFNSPPNTDLIPNQPTTKTYRPSLMKVKNDRTEEKCMQQMRQSLPKLRLEPIDIDYNKEHEQHLISLMSIRVPKNIRKNKKSQECGENIRNIRMLPISQLHIPREGEQKSKYITIKKNNN